MLFSIKGCCVFLFLCIFFNIVFATERIDWCNLSDFSTDEGKSRKKTMAVLQNITKSKSCQQMLSRLQKTKSLDLSKQDISNIEILIETNLDVLLLRSTSVSDLSVLQHQKNLKILDISHTNIQASQISYIPSESIETVYAESNNLQGIDFRALCGASTLKFVSLRNAQIENVESFQRCRHLSFLGLEGNEISDISMIRGLKNIKSIDLYGNPLHDCPVKKNSTLYQRCMEAKKSQWEKQLEK
jgi:Leucine-rich repeat (LRR) protein